MTYSQGGITIYQGDCLAVLSELPEQSVHCCVTSPPYWGLRSYLDDDHEDKGSEIGLEKSLEEYVLKMVTVFRGVWRVLRDDGTVWLNLGDVFCHDRFVNKMDGAFEGSDGLYSRKFNYMKGCSSSGPKRSGGVFKTKDLMGVPWHIAFALQADGWYLRSDIIWHKPNPMPEGVTDRPTKSHEYVFLLTKRQRYYYDGDAVRECDKGKGSGNKEAKPNHQPAGRSGRMTGFPWDTKGTRNLRDVWTIPTKSYPQAHFATFPPKLVEPCIKAGTSEEGCCPECGAPWERVVEKDFVKSQENNFAPECRGNATRGPEARTDTRERGSNKYTTTGWQPVCDCTGVYDDGHESHNPPPPVPCTVLDPFMGSGTTAEVARANGCKCIGIEINKEYIALAAKRLEQGVLW